MVLTTFAYPASAASPSAVAEAATQIIERGSDLSGPWQLFVDGFLIANVNGVKRTYHQFEKNPANPVKGINKFGGRGTVLLAEDR